MPPRKKGKGAARAASTPAGDNDTMVIDSPVAETPKSIEEPAKRGDALLDDPWTDEQETSLFKGLMTWKPNGVHKHFRMIALSEHLRNHGYDPRYIKHTRIPGIWTKLRTLYNMDIIDDRENSFEYEEDIKEMFLDFKLPDEDFGERTFMRGKRMGSEAGSSAASSPPRLNASPSPQITKKRKRGETVAKPRDTSIADTDEPRTSPFRSSPPKATTRSGRSTHRSMGRVQAESRSSRQPSKDTTVDEEVDDDADDAEEDDEEAEVEEEPSSPK
ncbi:Chromatin modification-related EAF7, partial [Hyphodiscus hymeniophilus]